MAKQSTKRQREKAQQAADTAALRTLDGARRAYVELLRVTPRNVLYRELGRLSEALQDTSWRDLYGAPENGLDYIIGEAQREA